MIPNIYKQYYGDETRWFIGTVVSISDPEELGRVKVRIFGVHSDNTLDIPNSALPWAHTVSPITEGGSSGIGTNVGIKPMAQVYGIFIDGKNSQVPLVIGSIPKFESNVRTFIDPSDISVIKPDDAILRGGTNVEKAFNYFISPEGGGFSVEQACGILGNYHVENGVNLRSSKDFDPDTIAVEKDGARAYGLAQWNDAPRAANVAGGLTRYAELLDFSTKNGLDYKSLYAQLAFTKYELFKYKRLFKLAEFQDAETVDQASEIFERKYLRPAEGSTEERKKEARNYYEEFV